MISSLLILDPKQRRALLYGTYALIGISTLVLVGNLALGFIARSDIKRLTIARKAKQDQLNQARRHTQPVQAVNKDDGILPVYAAIGRFQSKVYSIAAEESCKVDSFGSSGEPAPFKSNFGAIPDNSQIFQVTIQFNLTGNLGSVFETLQKLSNSGIPFEFSELDSAPAGLDPSKKSSTTAVVTRVEVHILTAQPSISAPGGTT